MLDEIKTKLESLDLGLVSYGRIKEKDLVKENKNVPWNYIVFGRERLSRTGTSQNDYNRYYKVVLVREDYIPEGMVELIIKELNTITGLRLAQQDISYDYLIKPGNQEIVEMAVITFTEQLKGYKL